jgi:serine phosphatase RsbU (regulator of sigma subunit)
MELTAGLAEQMDVQAIARYVLDTGVAAIGASAGSLCLITPDGTEFEVVGQVGYPEGVIEEWTRFPVDAPVPAADAVRAAAPVYFAHGDRGDLYPVFADTDADEGVTAVFPLLTRDRALGAVSFTFDGASGLDTDARSFLVALVAHCAIAIDRAELYASALRRQAQLNVLAESSSLLAGAGDKLEPALRAVAAVSVPTLADLCAILVVDGPNAARLVALEGRSNQNALGMEFSLDLARSRRLGASLLSGQPFVWTDPASLIDDAAESTAVNRKRLTPVLLGPGVFVPLVARGRVRGALVFANSRERALLTEEVAIATTLGQRMAVLIDNAQLLAQRTEISHGLQAALLPPALPRVEGFDLAARYQPAGEGLAVGGDFYDAIALGRRRWLFVVGDVTGHGVRAAAVTGLLRHTIAAAARLGSSPHDVLEHANRILAERRDTSWRGSFATAVLLDLTVGDGRPQLVVSSAGHPPPLLRRVDGTVSDLPAHGRLLGFFPDLALREVTVELDRGDTVVVYTDGVIERRDGAELFGEERLKSIVASTDGDADALAGAILTGVVDAFETPLQDDVAVLVLRLVA